MCRSGARALGRGRVVGTKSIITESERRDANGRARNPPASPGTSRKRLWPCRSSWISVRTACSKSIRQGTVARSTLRWTVSLIRNWSSVEMPNSADAAAVRMETRGRSWSHRRIDQIGLAAHGPGTRARTPWRARTPSANAATRTDRATIAQAQGRGTGGRRSGRSLSMVNQAAAVSEGSQATSPRRLMTAKRRAGLPPGGRAGRARAGPDSAASSARPAGRRWSAGR